MTLFIGGFDASGGVLPMTVERLRDAASDWTISPDVADGVAALLRTSQDLFVHAWFHYEFLVVAATWALLAVEAAFREMYAKRQREPLRRLLKRAEDDGRIDAEDLERLDAGAQLRNRLAHTNGEAVWSFGMAAGVIASAHVVINQVSRPRPRTAGG